MNDFFSNDSLSNLLQVMAHNKVARMNNTYPTPFQDSINNFQQSYFGQSNSYQQPYFGQDSNNGMDLHSLLQLLQSYQNNSNQDNFNNFNEYF